MTKTSAFLVYLTKTCFISIVKTEQKIRFSWIKLFVYMACSLGFFLANILTYYKVKAIKDAQIEQQLSVKVNIYNYQKRIHRLVVDMDKLLNSEF